ncbi:MAG: ABC transporter ATP-binding protein, partial [Butyricicoccus sp.]|nr:ABC transporter ATP-binding protein [Butyricicoccus sp.]
QCQRAAIARSLCLSPELLIADEPVAALDVSLQAQILNLFRELQRRHGFALLLIAHDLSVVRWLCDRVGVLCRGRLVEIGPAGELFERPAHPYTRALLSAIPAPDPRRERERRLERFDAASLPKNGSLFELAPGHFVLKED